MDLNYLIIIVSIIMCGGVSSEMNTVEEMYLNFFVQIESVKKSIDILKVRLDAVSEKNCCGSGSLIDFGVVKQYFDDFNNRLDPLIDSSKNKQQYVDKESFDDLKTQFDALTDNFKAKQQNVDSKMEKLESQQKILVQEISEMKGNYSNLLDELNTVTLSEKRLKEKYNDLEEKYLELIKNTETESKSNNDLKLRMDNITIQLSNVIASEAYYKKPLFDVRVDQLPEFKKEHCQPDSEAIDCKSATKCTQKSGYYKIYLPGNKAKQIMVFCDMEIAGGNWMHILRRIDGSENFTRRWSDYVNGFGNVEGEYWIGLENLNALTNNNGRQQLYVHVEVSSGVSSYALYDNFLVGDATDIYKLKSLGQYDGTAVDGMSINTGKKFSTIDYDNDESYSNCAKDCGGGGWFKSCGHANPTGLYRSNGVWWTSEKSRVYYYKIMYFMIRSF
ncbi:angiopoietin-related protein 2-like isoform X2 [Calliphora vicina]|uniref:angiopoietin-related protein 2-like isoform X2 n=1 Tax=Calliphora vicina TaxID=7373 RepID=UPI00325B2B98